MKSLEEVGHKQSEGYIDVLKRTREYFKEPGIFRICKGRWVIGITRDNPRGSTPKEEASG